MGITITPTEREWSRISKGMEIEGECIVCEKPQSRLRGKRYQTRRLFYDWFVGELEDTEEIVMNQYCTRGKKCVNPNHMMAYQKRDHADSVFLMWKNRESDVNLTQKERAITYGIPLSTVKRKDSGLSYKHLREDITTCKGPKTNKIQKIDVETPRDEGTNSDSSEVDQRETANG
jgi:hypothetical protein